MAETTACFATRPGVRLVSLGEYSICITHDMIQHRFSCKQQSISAKRVLFAREVRFCEA